MDPMSLRPAMNDTKWDELRLAMYSLGPRSPRWRTRDVEKGYESDWDGEWFYLFRAGGYSCIEWVELEITSDEQRDLVLDLLREIHVPGEATDNGFRVYGYLPSDRAVDYF